jgi:hypothetical protein
MRNLRSLILGGSEERRMNSFHIGEPVPFFPVFTFHGVEFDETRWRM